MLLATCCQDDIVPHVLPFVKENIKHADWRLRDASIMAFGAILEGPDPTNLKPIVEQAMPMLIELMTDKSVIVKVMKHFVKKCKENFNIISKKSFHSSDDDICFYRTLLHGQ